MSLSIDVLHRHLSTRLAQARASDWTGHRERRTLPSSMVQHAGWGRGVGQLKPASPPVSPGAARPLFCPQSSGHPRWPILGDRGQRSLLRAPAPSPWGRSSWFSRHTPSVHCGEKGSHRLDPPPKTKDLRSGPSPPGCRSRSLRSSQVAQHPREASRVAPMTAGVPWGAPPPVQLLQSSPWPVSFAHTPPGGHG